jgi:DNA-directed RNA polymerase subunit M/transcription elongation factor TFIIS
MSKKLTKHIEKKDDDYEKIINRMERDIEKLKAKNKVLMDALKTTETYLLEISKDKTIQEIFQEVHDNTELNVEEKCPKCGSHGMKKINLGYVNIASCSCGYRNRINGSEPR